MFGEDCHRTIGTKLDYTPPIKDEPNRQDQLINERDERYKARMDNSSSAKAHSFIQGHYVLLKQRKTNKWSTPYETTFYVITKFQESRVTVKRLQDGRELMRDANHLKLANAVMQSDRKKRPSIVYQTLIGEKNYKITPLQKK
eukprot:gene10027-18657_t